MRAQFVIPVLTSILILGAISPAILSQQVFAVTTVIDTDTTGKLKVKSGDTLTIKNGATITGDIKVKGGTLNIIEGSTVNGDIKAKKCDSINISEGSIINGKVKVEKCDNVTITGNTINGELEVEESGAVIVTGNTVTGELEIEDNTSCTEGGNTVGEETEVEDCVAPVNTLPTIGSVTLVQRGVPTSSIDRAAPVECTENDVSDPDGPNLTTFTYEWFREDGAVFAIGSTLTTAKLAEPAVDENITCKVTPFDGIDSGVPVSQTATINNFCISPCIGGGF